MAVSEYYVDPQSGNDTTGDGTSGTPWKTVQKALDTITRNSTDGDRINVKATTADTLGAALSRATYGTPTAAASLTIQGYTSTAGDGGIGVIDGAATYSICTSWSYTHFVDMKLGNCGSANVLNSFGTNSSAVNCEIHTTSGYGVDCGVGPLILGCWLHDLTGTYAIVNSTNVRILYNFIDCATTTGVISGGAVSLVLGNIIDLSGADTSVIGINCSNLATMTVIGNTIYCSNANTAQGILSTGAHLVVLNNIVEGWSGTGGDGIEASSGGNSIIGANAVYNCATAYTLAAAKLNFAVAANDTLGATPFTNANSDDFSIKDSQTGVTEDAYPSTFRGL